jgi:hypothetical protein
VSDYIRSTSNPEGLIVHDVDGFQVESPSGNAAVRLQHAVKPPLSSKSRKAIDIPSNLFADACEDWARSSTTPVNDRGLKIQEVFVYLDTGKRAPVGEGFDRPRAFLIRLSYGGQFVHMWRVTWEHVVHAFLRGREIKAGRASKW